MDGFQIFLVVALVVMLACLGVVLYIGYDLHKDAAKMRRDCCNCALKRTKQCPWLDCYVYAGHPYFQKIPRKNLFSHKKHRL